jgi:hypothetical protein
VYIHRDGLESRIPSGLTDHQRCELHSLLGCSGTRVVEIRPVSDNSRLNELVNLAAEWTQVNAEKSKYNKRPVWQQNEVYGVKQERWTFNLAPGGFGQGSL